jgi:hypothetical protein
MEILSGWQEKWAGVEKSHIPYPNALYGLDSSGQVRYWTFVKPKKFRHFLG